MYASIKEVDMKQEWREHPCVCVCALRAEVVYHGEERVQRTKESRVNVVYVCAHRRWSY